MKAEGDKIQFESRREIEDIMAALIKSENVDNESVKELIKKLDLMHMCW